MNRSLEVVTLEPKELRNIIKGITEIRKCPDCEGHGESWTLHYVSADDPKELEQFKDVSEVVATNFVVDDYPEYSWGECYLYDCENCSGIGYIFIEEY
jgi:hypothetical protein